MESPDSDKEKLKGMYTCICLCVDALCDLVH